VETLPASPLADRLLAFDEEEGLLRAEAGLSLGAIEQIFWPRNWTFPVLPGTQYVTLGGIVASDVHGKNHHIDGTIEGHITALRLRLANGQIADCSHHEEPDLFRATVGGMGLTGHILEVEVRMQRIPTSWIWTESRRISGIGEFIAALRAAADSWPFTVGWMDALARGRSLGRGILICGRWARPEEAPSEPPKPKRRISVPFVFPEWFLNRLSMRFFNTFYYRRHPARPRRGVAHPEAFFHPLDAVRHWNRIYGRRGFTQHQCVLPESENPGATERYLEELTRRGLASFLCVIKDCGPEGEGLLSFPRSGISIAVDLPIRPSTKAIVDQLNRRVIEEGGRIYLTKDSLTRREDFRAMEPRLDHFLEVRRQWDPDGRLASAQSVRLLGIEP
jgi:FAD/FMN-containing dehydrogenase